MTEFARKKSERIAEIKNRPATVAELRPRSQRRLVWRKFLRHRLAAIGMGILLVLFIASAFAHFLAPYDPFRIDIRERLQPPSAEHVLGTDDLGRDVLARLMLGGQVSLSVGLLAMLVALIVGVTIGSVAGYYGGKIDNVLMRFTDLMFTYPPIILAMIIISVIGASLSTLAFVIGILSWMGLARLVRGSFLAYKEQDFVTAAHSIGASNQRIIFYHILPNIVGTITVAVTLGVARAVLLESGLSYLGLGIQVPVPSWGSMLYLAQGQIQTASWLSLSPGALIFIAVLSINFVGDGLRDALDPRMQRG